LIKVKRGAQDIFVYAYVWRPSKAMSASLEVRLSFSASLYQLLIPSVYSSRFIQVFVVLKVHSSALRWNRWPYPIVVGL